MTDITAPENQQEPKEPQQAQTAASPQPSPQPSILPELDVPFTYEPVISPISQQAFEERPRKPIFKPIDYSEYSEEQKEQLINSYLNNPRDADWAAFDLVDKAQTRVMAQHWARLHHTDSIKAANRKAWAADLLGVPLSVVENNPEAAIQEAEVVDYTNALSRYPAVLKMFSDPQFIKRLSAKDVAAFDRAQTVIGAFSNGISLASLEHDANALSNEIVRLQLEGQEVPSDLRQRLEDLNAQIAEKSSYTDGVSNFIGSIFGGLGTSLWAAKEEAYALTLIGAGAGALGAPVTAGAGFSVGLVTGLARDAIDQARGSIYNELKKLGVDEATAVRLANSRGTLAGAIEAATNLIPGGIAFKSVNAVRAAATREFLSTAAGRELKEALSEIAGSSVIGGLSEASSQVILNTAVQSAGIERKRYDQVLSSFIQGMAGDAVMGVALGAPNLMISASNAIHSARANAIVKKLVEDAKESDLAQTDPDAAANVFNQMAHEGNINFVYISPDVFEQALAQYPTDADTVRSAIPDFDKQLAVAKETGGQIEIDLGTWVSRLAQTKLGESLADYFRTEPDGFSDRELQERSKEMPEETQATIKAMSEQDAAALEFDKSIQEIRADLSKSIKDTGIAHKYANQAVNLTSAFISTMSRRLGVEPQQLYKDLALKFARKPSDSKTLGAYDPASRTIFFDENSDASTVAHEGAHFFLDTITRLSELNHNLDRTMDALMGWFGITREEWKTLSADDRETYHELFAEAWEQYLSTAQAPSKKLSRMFSFFTDWISSAYRMYQKDGVKLPEDVAQLFDTLIAAEDEIQLMREARIDEPLLTGEMANFLSDEDKAVYQTAIEDHFQALQAQANQQLLANTPRLEKKNQRFLKTLNAERKRSRKQYMLEAKMNVRQRPAYQIMDIAQRGSFVLNGQEVEIGKYKISRASAAAYVDADTLRKLGYKRILSDDPKNSASIEELLDLIGNSDADIAATLKQIADQPDFRRAINLEADRLVSENLPLLGKEENRKDAANTFITQETADSIMAIEIKNLLKAKVSSREFNRVAQSVANRIFNGLPQQKINERTFRAQEQRCNNLALKALKNNDVAGAARHRYHALINRKLARKAISFKIEKARAYSLVKGLYKKRSSPNYDPNWINIAETFATVLGFKTNQVPLLDSVMQAVNPEAYEALMRVRALAGNVTEVSKMTVEEFHDAYIDLQGYVTKARQERLFINRGKAENIETAVNEMVAATDRQELKDRVGESEFGTEHTPTKFERFKHFLMTVGNATRSAENLFAFLEGQGIHEGAGAWLSRTVTYLRERSTRASLRTTKMRQELAAIYKEMDLQRNHGQPIKFHCAETGADFTFNADGQSGMAQIIMLLLNLGNRDNARKLVLGGRKQIKGQNPDDYRAWGVEREDGTIDFTSLKNFISGLIKDGKLTKKDFECIDKIFKLFKKEWPNVQKARFEVEGKYSKEIEPEFQLNDILPPEWGLKLEGGYFPVVYDADLFDARADRSVEDLTVNNGDLLLPNANNSFIKDRTATKLGGLSLNINIVEASLAKQIWYSDVQPALTEVSKLLRQPKILATIRRLAPGASVDIIQPWLQGIARGGSLPVSDQKMLTKTIGLLNNRSTMLIMGANILNTAQQITGLLTAMPYVGLKNTLYGVGAVLRDIGPRGIDEQTGKKRDGLREHIEALSPQMRLRWSRLDEQASSELDKALGLGLFERQQKNSSRNVYIMQSLFQGQIDRIIWYGAFNEFNEKHPDAKQSDAVAYADAAVIRTQSSSRPEDRAKLQNLNNAWAKAFGMFFSFFVTQRNLHPMVGRQWAQSLGWTSPAGQFAAQAASYFALAVLPLALGQFIADALRGDWEEKNDEELQAYLARTLLGVSLTAGLTIWVPYIGGYSSTAFRKNVLGEDNLYLGDTPLNSPAVSLITQNGPRMWRSATDGEFTSKDLMNMMQAMSAVTGIAYPAMLSRPIAGAYDMIDKNSSDFRALFSGKVPEEK